MDIIKDSFGDSDNEDLTTYSKQTELSEFDIVIGHIEDILIGKFKQPNVTGFSKQ